MLALAESCDEARGGAAVTAVAPESVITARVARCGITVHDGAMPVLAEPRGEARGAAAHYEVPGVDPRGEARGGAAVPAVAPESVTMAWPSTEPRHTTKSLACWRSRVVRRGAARR